MNNRGFGWILCIVGGIILIYLVWDTYFANEVEYVVAPLDGRTYLVRSLPNKEEAANLLAEVRDRCERLIAHLSKKYPNDHRVIMLADNFQPDKLSEGADNSKYTSYSINKGESIVFCLRQKDKDKTLIDINTIMFVTLHELAHLGTDEIGHTPTFWDNMRFFVDESVDVGIYTKVDYKTKPVDYCGITIKSVP